jgi:DNA-binding SARP family transcriptional activator
VTEHSVCLLTLGELRLVAGPVELLPGRRKDLVLLAYLLTRAPRSVPRAELAALLWGEKDEARARQSLRQALRDLKGALGERIEIARESVQVAADRVVLDCAAFQADLVAGRLEGAVARYRGGFLAELDEVGGEAFRDWIETERERLRRLCMDALARLADAAEQRGEWSAAAEWLERWAQLDPLSEAAHTRLIQALRLAGQMDRATTVQAAFVARSRQELGSEPTSEFLHRTDAASADPARRAPAADPSRSAALFSPDLVGRGAVFARLAGAWQEVSRGGAAVLLVEGEEGIGKTRLCEEFLQWLTLSASEALVLRSRAFVAEQETEWAVARDLLAGLGDAPGLGGAPDDALAAVSELVPSIRSRFPRLPSMTGSTAQFHGAVHRVLSDVAAEVPLLLFVDDLPSADEETRLLLFGLARRLPGRCMVLATANTAAPGFPRVVEALSKIPTVQRLPLDALGLSEVEALLDSMLLLEPAERRDLALRLHAETHGNPFYTVALVAALADSGFLARDPQGVWRIVLDGGADLPLPGSVREAVEARLRHLSPAAREALGSAAVLGRTIDPAWLEALTGQPPGEFCDAVEELIARRLLRLAPSAPGHYEFSHDLVRRVTFELLGPARQQVLQRSAARVPERQLADPASGTAAAPQSAASAAQTERRRWRSGWTRAAAVALLVLVIGAASGIAAFRDRAALAVSGSLAVLPFEYRGSEDFRYLGEGLADLLSVSLDGAGELSSVDPRVLMGFAAQNGQHGVGREEGRVLASRFGAEFYVLGSVVESRGRLQVHAALHGGDGQPLATASAIAETEAGVPELVDDLARQLLAGRVRGMAAPLAQTAAVTTTSLPALRRYLDGERLLREGRFGDAATAFAAATEADTAFALAHYRLSVALEWAVADGRLIDAAMNAAVRHADRLPLRARLLVEAANARRRGQANRADSLYHHVLSLSHNDFEATFHLAEIQFHDRPLRSVSLTTAKPLWYQVLTLDPGNGFALVHLARIAAVEDSLGAFLDRHAAAVDAMSHHDRRGLELEFWKVIRTGRPVTPGPLDPLLRSDTYLPVAQVVGYSRDFSATERLLRELGSLRRPTWMDDVMLAGVLAAQGRWRAADSLLAFSRNSDQVWQLYHGGFLATAASGVGARWDVRRTHEKLLRWNVGDHGERRLVRAYLLALTGAAAGEPGALAERAAEVERAQESALRHDLALTLRAELLRRQGRRDEALRLIASARMEAAWDQSFNSPIHSRAYLRWLGAELLREQGQDVTALRIYETLGQASPFEIALVAPAHLRRAQIYDRRGERQQAAEHYRRFAEMWKDADPELQPLVQQARQRLRELDVRR